MKERWGLTCRTQFQCRNAEYVLSTSSSIYLCRIYYSSQLKGNPSTIYNFASSSTHFLINPTNGITHSLLTGT